MFPSYLLVHSINWSEVQRANLRSEREFETVDSITFTPRGLKVKLPTYDVEKGIDVLNTLILTQYFLNVEDSRIGAGLLFVQVLLPYQGRLNDGLIPKNGSGIVIVGLDQGAHFTSKTHSLTVSQPKVHVGNCNSATRLSRQLHIDEKDLLMSLTNVSNASQKKWKLEIDSHTHGSTILQDSPKAFSIGFQDGNARVSSGLLCVSSSSLQ
jgi:hypothetical protein